MVPPKEAYSIHGSAIQIEVPENLSGLRRWGGGVQLAGKPNTTNVFHFPITIRLIREGEFNPGLCSYVVGLWFTFASGSKAKVVHVFANAGNTQIFGKLNVNLSQKKLTKAEYFFDNPVKITKAIDIVIHVAFMYDFFNQKSSDFAMEFEEVGVYL